MSEHTTWGALTLLRGRHRPDFALCDTALVASVADTLADGLRRATLRDACHAVLTERGVGLVVLAADGSLVAVDPVAERCAGARCGTATRSPWRSRPSPVRRAASRPDGPPPTRSPGPGSALPPDGGSCCTPAPSRGRTRPRPSSSNRPRCTRSRPSIASAYGLTERERAVTRLVARGLATAEIGAELHLSPWTVQDHLKAIFAKVGVRSRGELVARLFFPDDAPELTG